MRRTLFTTLAAIIVVLLLSLTGNPLLAQTTFSEDWESGIDTGKWNVWGSPYPEIVFGEGCDGSDGMDPSGDGWCPSGVWSVEPVSWEPGCVIGMCFRTNIYNQPRQTLHQILTIGLASGWQTDGYCAYDAADWVLRFEARIETEESDPQSIVLKQRSFEPLFSQPYPSSEDGTEHSVTLKCREGGPYGSVELFYDGVHLTTEELLAPLPETLYLAVDGRSVGITNVADNIFAHCYPEEVPPLELESFIELDHALAAVVGDVDNDGENEILASTREPSMIHVFDSSAGSYELTWSEPVSGMDQYGPISLVVADTDSDGMNEIVVGGSDGDAGGYVLIYEQVGSSSEWTLDWQSPLISSIRRPREIAVGDSDNDGANELWVAVNWYDRHLVMYEYDGGTYSECWSHSFGSDCNSVVVGDADCDGLNEVVVGTGQWGTLDVRVYQHIPGTTCDYELCYSHELGGRQEVFLADSDMDGCNEMLVASTEGGVGMTIFEAVGDCDFTVDWTCGDCEDRRVITAGDLLCSGGTQIAVKQDMWDEPELETVSLYQYDGAGYTELDEINVGTGIRMVDIGDSDDDCYEEVVICGWHPDVPSTSGIFIYSAFPSAGTVSTDLSCQPSSGTLPFFLQLDADISNNETSHRKVSARIDVVTANGTSYPNWRSGSFILQPGGTKSVGILQALPASQSLVGTNTFTLIAEDTTPAPFNQPPYAPSGDSDSEACSVVGIAP